MGCGISDEEPSHGQGPASGNQANQARRVRIFQVYAQSYSIIGGPNVRSSGMGRVGRIEGGGDIIETAEQQLKEMESSVVTR